jgi:DHA1 family inner membrane transport protein
MPTAIFNLGTAAGTGITGAALESGLGVSAPPMIGTISATLVLVPLGVLALLERRVTHRQRREPATVPSEQGSREP